jgi:molecular chaperone GrpE
VSSEVHSPNEAPNGASDETPNEALNGASDSPADGQADAPGSKQSSDSRISELEALAKDKENKYLYLYADFENYKKRAIKERSELIKFGWEPVARELIQVLDNLELALGHVPPGTDQALVDGLRMVSDQFKATLAKQGVQPVGAIKQAFDPNLHEAVAQESSDEPAGTIIKEQARGYTIHGRLLRPARVVVSGGKAQAS